MVANAVHGSSTLDKAQDDIQTFIGEVPEEEEGEKEGEGEGEGEGGGGGDGTEGTGEETG